LKRSSWPPCKERVGSALTVLYGPNGFGKTSFFDAIDFAITGGLGRLSSLSEGQLDKVLPHLDTRPRDGVVSLSFRRNGEIGSLTRNVRDRKWAMLNGARSDRKTVLSSLTKGSSQSADRVENFISLFRATHLFNQERQEIAKDFRTDCQLNESIVSRHRGAVKFTEPAFDKTVIYKRRSANHLLSQIESFRVGDKKSDREDDLLDTFCYGIALALGDGEGF
jgi:AAA domain